MLLAQTGDGIARVGSDGLLLLGGTGDRPLADFIVEGRLAELAGLRPEKEIGWEQAGFWPPVRRPGKIVVIGLNYRDHAAETDSPLPAFPRFHLIPGSAVTAPGATVPLPACAPGQVDYEGELAVVIGRTGRDIPESAAWDHIAGGTVADDLSARDVQFGRNAALPMASPAVAKGFDGFKPLGPALLTADELRLHDALDLTTEVNGVVRQRSSTAELVFSVPQLVAYVSSFLTLEAGDVLLTGTPGGTGMADGRFLTAGDVVTVTVGGIGSLVNTIGAPRSGPRREEAR
jgi:2-keto-4-pentenoate hydratase/2-oxohepta-3-ene-1,7-dioic acid hydratase in catechol pathway